MRLLLFIAVLLITYLTAQPIFAQENNQPEDTTPTPITVSSTPIPTEEISPTMEVSPTPQEQQKPTVAPTATMLTVTPMPKNAVNPTISPSPTAVPSLSPTPTATSVMGNSITRIRLVLQPAIGNVLHIPFNPQNAIISKNFYSNTVASALWSTVILFIALMMLVASFKLLNIDEKLWQWRLNLLQKIHDSSLVITFNKRLL